MAYHLIRFILFSGLCHHAFAGENWNCTDLLDWNFFGSNVTANNLGGNGPNASDAQEIRYSNVLTKGNSQADLVVKVASGSTDYLNGGNTGVLNNGKPPWNNQPGQFGSINIRSSSAATFVFTLVDTGTDTPFR